MTTSASFSTRISSVADHIKEHGAGSKEPEQVLREDFEAALACHFEEWGIEFEPQMERRTITRGRLDMLCGRVVTEYKAPGVLKSSTGYGEALLQARDYLEDLAREYGEPLDAYYGIVTDGSHVGFLHYTPEDGWDYSKRLPFDEKTARRILERYRAHSKRPLDAEGIAAIFGPDGEVARAIIPCLVDLLKSPIGKAELLFKEWKRLFGQAVGTEADQYTGMIAWAEDLGAILDLDDPDAIAKFFFATHTYDALIIKLITADIVGTVRSKELVLFAQQMAKATLNQRGRMLRDLEDNVLFDNFGITNFLEGDFFSWYIDSYNDELDQAIQVAAEALARFEPATPLLAPPLVTDLFKRLYQYIVPKDIRHDLGEFYTPDWLADYLLRRAGFYRDPTGSLLDPACGSGTLLVRAIRAIHQSFKETRIGNDDQVEEAIDSRTVDLLEHLRARRIVGLDLNPLAVISARANLILALLQEIETSQADITLPVYLADSIYVPTKETDKYVYRLRTEKGLMEMTFPAELVESGDFAGALREIESFIKNEDGPDPNSVPKHSLTAKNGLQGFYEQVWELDQEEWNRIWCRVVLNRFAPAVIGPFDFIVGNPPWVLWSNLPESYRDAVKPVCDHYDLFSDDTWVGGIESDISTVLTYAAADRWLKPDGILAFLITQSVFKTRSAQGFRRFRLPPNSSADEPIPLKVLQVDDLVSIKPFEDAQNRTATLFIKKGSKTEYPVPYLVWQRRSSRDVIRATDSLPRVLRSVQLWPHEAAPAGSYDSAWVTAPTGRVANLLSLLGGEGLSGRKGTTTDFNNIFWVKPMDRDGDLVLVENNQSHLGHQVETVQFWVEEDIVYPLARGREVGRFRVAPPKLAIILPQEGMRGYSRETMRDSFPRALKYFKHYKHNACIGCSASDACSRGLDDRGSYSNPKYRSAMGEYWAVWNVGEYSFAPYKVVWKEVSSQFEAAVIDRAKFGVLEEKIRIPDHKLMLLPCADEDEAHYYCGLVNSRLLREFAEAVSLSTSRGTRIFEQIQIPSFNPESSPHRAVAELSRQAHRGRILDDRFEEELSEAVGAALGSSVHTQTPSDIDFEWEDPLISEIRDQVQLSSIPSVEEGDRPLDDLSFVAIDLETTGFSPMRYADRVVEIGAVQFDRNGVGRTWQSTVWPNRPISRRAQQVHGISIDELMDAPTFDTIVDELLTFVGESVVVMHCADFDWPFLAVLLAEARRTWSPVIIDTLAILRAHFSLPSNRLADALHSLGIEQEALHSALIDANATAHLFLRILELLKQRTDLATIADLIALQGRLFPLSVALPDLDQRVIDWVLEKQRVQIDYSRQDTVIAHTGSLVGVAHGTASTYYSLEFDNGKRIFVRDDNVRGMAIAD